MHLKPCLRLVVLLLLLAPLSGRAQFKCGSDLLQQRNAAAKALHKAEWAASQRGQAQARKMHGGFDTDSAVTIPLVFHILHLGNPVGGNDNPSDAAIDSLIAYLNGSWSAIWPDLPDAASGGVSIPVRFALAKRSPDCGATSGIERIDGRQFADYETFGVKYLIDPNYEELMARTAWPVEHYYNIWIVHAIDGLQGGTGGFAYYPGSSRYDGTFLLASLARPFPGTALYPVAITHELGHAFDLPHTFEGSEDTAACPPNGDCLIDGDGICDTEPHRRIAPSDYCPQGVNPCTGGDYAGVSQNFMNYTNCADRFTAGQRERILWALRRYRMGLVHSNALLPPPGVSESLRAAACVPVSAGADSGIGVRYFRIADASHENLPDSLVGAGYADRSCLRERAVLLQDSTYAMRIMGGRRPQRQQVWIDYNDNGSFEDREAVLPADELLFPGAELQAELRIPGADVVTGRPLRMRIIAVCDTCGPALIPPCGALTGAYAEDFAVRITPHAKVLDEVVLYPNPARNRVGIQSLVPVEVSVYSVNGVLLLRTKGDTLNVGAFASGLYFARIAEIAHPERVRTLKLQVMP